LFLASFCELARRVDPERRPAVARDQRLSVLAEAGKVLGASLDYRRTLQDLTEVGLGTLGELCAVGLVEDSGRLRLVAGAHVDPTKRLLLEALCDQPLATCSEIATVVRRGKSRVLEEVDGETLGDVYESDWHLTIVRALQLGPTLIAPLTVRRQTIGVLVFSAPPGAPRYERADVALAEDLAQRAAIAVDNAGLFTRTSEVAHILQHSLLPPRPPRIPGVEIAARYHPAGEYLEVGGDFYDAFSLGRNGWGLLIADVASKGPAAAATTALVRHTTRATARRGCRFDVPAAVNDALLEAEDDETFCTMIYGHLRLGDGAPSLDLLNCGHPAPLFMRAEGQIDQVECRGPLLGQFPSTTVDPAALAPLPGDVLVFVTDGVLEARAPRSRPDSRWFGYEGLAAVLRDTRGESAGTIAEMIEARTVAFSGGSPGDDLAVLVLRFL
jgi:serine phosphatase RsbU (regulator of sigma subunit)